MKELSIEEKARRYDEAIERANELSYVSDKDSLQCKTIEHIFPELKESEDEKIRKAIINVFASHKDYEVFFGVSVKDILAWLEKQGEKEWSNEVGSLCLEACSLLRAYSEEIPYNSQLGQKIKRVEAFLGDLYHEAFYPSTYNPRPDIISPEWSDKDDTIIKIICNEGNLKPSEIQWLNNLCYRVKQQKPAWSDEDKKMIDSIIDYMTPMPIFFESTNGKSGKEYTQEFVKNAINWLESLKERVQRPRQEWSEEDEYLLDETIQHLEELIRIDKAKHCGVDVQYYQRDINWLKSLRPHSQWKPSDEQIKALNEAIYHVDDSIATQIAMLIGDLKKL